MAEEVPKNPNGGKIAAAVFRFCRLKIIFAGLLAALLAAPPMLLDLPGHSYHVDEDAWLCESYYYGLFFKKRDMHAPEWQRHEVKFNGLMGKYVLGFGLEQAGVDFHPTIQYCNGWWPSNQHLPEKSPRLHPQIVNTGRLVCAILGWAVAVMLFFIGYQLGGCLAGFTACLFFAYDSLAQSICRHAMGDSPLIFFVTAAILVQGCLLPLLAKPLRCFPVILFLALLESFFLGCAVNTKLNGALAAISFVAAVLLSSLAIVFQKRENGSLGEQHWLRKRLAIAGWVLLLGVMVGAASFGVFVYFNPFVRPHPIDGLNEILNVTRSDLKNVFASFPQDQLNTLAQKSRYVWDEVCYGRNVFLPAGISGILRASLVALGFLVLTGRMLRSVFRRGPSAVLAGWAWVVAAFIGVTVWIPVHWDRYLIPAIPCACVLAGVGAGSIGGLLQWLARKLFCWKSRSPASSMKAAAG